MAWTWALTALAAFAGVTPAAAPVVDDPPAKVARAAQASHDLPPLWQLSMNVSGPVTSTDPRHVAMGIGAGRAGRYRAGFKYQPSESDLLGLIHSRVGFRLLRRDSLDVAFDLDVTQVWADRRLFRGTGWQLEGHDRRRLSLGMVSILPRGTRYFGLIDGIELGAGRMYIRRLVSARAGSEPLSPQLDTILISSGPVGMIGLHMARPLFRGFTGDAHVRLIGAGRSRGGEVPFAHLTTEWSVTHQVFTSQKFGRGELGVTGNHATSSRAATYFQNGLGLTFRIAF